MNQIRLKDWILEPMVIDQGFCFLRLIRLDEFICGGLAVYQEGISLHLAVSLLSFSSDFASCNHRGINFILKV